MREHPIVFSTPMVQAILEGKKTQTRSVIKPQPSKDEPNINYCTIEGFQTAPPGEEIWADTEKGESVQLKPKYEKGDVLWVRETWTKDVEGFIYKADLEDWQLQRFDSWNYKWKPSIHMPRKAARLFLKVKSVRVERLRDISEKDAKAEGVEKFNKCKTLYRDRIRNQVIACGGGAYPIVHCVDCDKFKNTSFKNGFMFLWEALNAKGGYSFKSNPYVWVYEFMRVEK